MAEEEQEAKLRRALMSAGEKYRDRTTLRAAVQAIPYVGGPIDTLLSGHAGKRQEERFESFLGDLHQRLSRVEGLAEVDQTELFFDLMLDVFDRVIRTRSEEKRSHFAQVVVNQVKGNRDWESASEAVRLLGGLSDVHIEVLREALSAEPCGEPFTDLRVISLAVDELSSENIIKPVKLLDALPGYSPLALRMACSELVSRGLLHDEGVGRWDLGPLAYLVPTELAEWFVKEINADA